MYETLVLVSVALTLYVSHVLRAQLRGPSAAGAVVMFLFGTLSVLLMTSGLGVSGDWSVRTIVAKFGFILMIVGLGCYLTWHRVEQDDARIRRAQERTNLLDETDQVVVPDQPSPPAGAPAPTADAGGGTAGAPKEVERVEVTKTAKTVRTTSKFP